MFSPRRTKQKLLHSIASLAAVVVLLLPQMTVANNPPKTVQPGKMPSFHPSRILVKPKVGPNAKAVAAELSRAHAANGGKVLRAFPALGGLQILGLPANVDVEGAADRYRRSGLVEYAEVDYEVHIAAAPNDPYYVNGNLWGMHNTGQNSGVNDADIDAPEAWDVRTEASNVIVAVIDTGIRYSHQDLTQNMWRNLNEIPGNGVDDDANGFVDDVFGVNAITYTGDPNDDNGHGTHVAGTIGAVGNNGLGVTGVAWNVRLMACKFLNSFGSGYVSDAIICIDYARARGASIMNNSWGGGGASQALSNAIAAARAQGIIFVAAAGNNASNNDLTPFYPASYSVDNIVVVAATTARDELAYFSNFGQGTVDIAAPGAQIYSTWYTGDSAYHSISGTSMAAPMVSGVLALMRAQFPTENYFQILNRVYGTADPLNPLATKCRTGGRINLARALTTVSSRPLNDNFSGRMLLTGTSFSIKGINVDATKEPNESAHAGLPGGKSVWWAWRAPSNGVVTVSTSGSSFDTLLAAYAGAGFPNLTLVAQNDNFAATGTSSQITFEAIGGVEYHMAVDGVSAASGSVVLKVTFMPRPGNDEFVNRIPIIGSIATVTGSNTLATIESGEPLHGGVSGGHSVWWSWTPATSELVSISTAGSAINTVLAVYTGNTISNLTLVASNDDHAGGLTSRVTFNAAAGTTYQIAVDGYNGGTGGITLNTPPSNDHFANRIVLTGSSPSATGFNALGTRQTDEPNHAGNAGGKSLWWSWTAPATEKITINTLGSTFDTLLAVYTNATLSDLSLVASNDNNLFGDSTSILTLEAKAGTTYQIAVDGASGAFGKVELAVGNSGYAITEIIPPAGYNNTAAYAVNVHGTVAGAFMGDAPSYTPHACIWTSSGGLQRLFPSDIQSQANDINDFGQVVGYVTFPGQSKVAFTWQNGVVTYLGSLNGLVWNEAYGIDNGGRVVGWSVDGSANEKIVGFIWQNGIMKSLPTTPGCRSSARRLTGEGFIVGGESGPDGTSAPVLWRNYQHERLTMPTPMRTGSATSVNSLGQIVGYYHPYTGQGQGYLWENGAAIHLNQPLEAWAIGINNLGQIVGGDYVVGRIWQNNQWVALTNLLPASSGWTNIFTAEEINDRGQLVGSGRRNGYTRAFLMTPLSLPAPMPVIVSPTNQQKFYTSSAITILPTFLPDASQVSHVDYLRGNVLIGSSSEAPYSIQWENVPAGAYQLVARVTTVSGTTRTSRPVTISVQSNPTLRMFFTGSNSLDLSWSASSTSFSVETATNLNWPIEWKPLTNTVVVSNGTNSITTVNTNDAHFFRLRNTAP